MHLKVEWTICALGSSESTPDQGWRNASLFPVNSEQSQTQSTGEGDHDYFNHSQESNLSSDHQSCSDTDEVQLISGATVATNSQDFTQYQVPSVRVQKNIAQNPQAVHQTTHFSTQQKSPYLYKVLKNFPHGNQTQLAQQNPVYNIQQSPAKTRVVYPQGSSSVVSGQGTNTTQQCGNMGRIQHTSQSQHNPTVQHGSLHSLISHNSNKLQQQNRQDSSPRQVTLQTVKANTGVHTYQTPHGKGTSHNAGLQLIHIPVQHVSSQKKSPKLQALIQSLQVPRPVFRVQENNAVQQCQNNTQGSWHGAQTSNQGQVGIHVNNAQPQLGNVPANCVSQASMSQLGLKLIPQTQYTAGLGDQSSQVSSTTNPGNSTQELSHTKANILTSPVQKRVFKLQKTPEHQEKNKQVLLTQMPGGQAPVNSAITLAAPVNKQQIVNSTLHLVQGSVYNVDGRLFKFDNGQLIPIAMTSPQPGQVRGGGGGNQRQLKGNATGMHMVGATNPASKVQGAAAPPKVFNGRIFKHVNPATLNNVNTANLKRPPIHDLPAAKKHIILESPSKELGTAGISVVESTSEVASPSTPPPPREPPKPPDQDGDYYAICVPCGNTSKDYLNCDSCGKPLPDDPKWYNRDSKEVQSKPKRLKTNTDSSTNTNKVTKLVLLQSSNKDVKHMKLIQVNPSGSGITKQSFYSKKLGEQLNPYIDKDKDLNFDPSTALGATYGVQKKGEKKSTRGGKSSRGRGRGRTVYAPPPEPETVTILSSDDEEQQSSSNSSTPAPRSTANTPVPAPSPSSQTEQEPVQPILSLNKGRVARMENPETAGKTKKTVSKAKESSSQSSGIRLMLDAKTVMIGTLKGTPYEPIVVSKEGIQIKMESSENSISISIQPDEIMNCFGHFQQVMAMFLYTSPVCGQRIRSTCRMSKKGGPYYDPGSSKNVYKRITFIFRAVPPNVSEQLEKICEDIFDPLKHDGTIYCDINNREAVEWIAEASVAIGSLGEEDARAQKRNTRSQTQKEEPSLAEMPQESRTPSPVRPMFSGPVEKLFIWPPPPKTGGITITNEDFFCLNEGEFLNDVIIDFYLKYLWLEVLSEEDRNRTHIFSSFFYRRLTQKPAKRHAYDDDANITPAVKRHSRVKTWTRHVDLFAKDFVIVPINESSHWFLAIICFPGLDTIQKVPYTKKETIYIVQQTPTKTKGKSMNAKAGKDLEKGDKDSLKPDTDAESTTSSSPTPSTSSTSQEEIELKILDSQDLINAGLRFEPKQKIDKSTEGNIGQNDSEESQNTPGPKQSGKAESSEESPMDTDEKQTEGEVIQDDADSNMDTSQEPDSSSQEKEQEESQPKKPIKGKDGKEELLELMKSGKVIQAVKEISCVGIKQPSIIIFDSLSGPARNNIIKTLKEYLQVEWDIKKKTKKSFDKDTIKGGCAKCPQQTNYSDCGVYVLQYVESFFKTPIQDYHVPNLRNLENWFPDEVVKKKREEIKDLILRIKDELELGGTSESKDK